MKMKGLLIALLLVLLAMPAVGQVDDRESNQPDHFSILLIDALAGELWWEADYLRTLSPGIGWTDGDRSGYRCAYMFLYKVGRRGRLQMIGRATFIRVEGAADYGKVNDRYMDEGIRYFDGSLDPTNGTANDIKELGDCPQASSGYEPFDGSQLPTIRFMNGNQVLETRDYKAVVAAEGITFQQVSKSDASIGVVAYDNGLPVIEVYYDSLVRGVTLTSDIG